MATRSTIGLQDEDGMIHAIYCHFDGYFSGVGKTLLEHYLDVFEIEPLIELGNISSLEAEIGEPHDFDSREPEHETWCRAYGRDRGEPDQQARVYKSLKEFVDNEEQAYMYLYRNGQWYAKTWSGSRFTALTAVRCGANKDSE